MPRQHMTDLWVRNLGPHALDSANVRTLDYFDDPAKSGIRGLVLRYSYGGTKTWRVMYYPKGQGGKSKTWKLGRYPVMSLSATRKAAQEFLGDPKKFTENRPEKQTFENVAQKYIESLQKRNVRTTRVIQQRINKHLMRKFKHFDFDSIRRADLASRLDKIETTQGTAMADAILSIFSAIANWYRDNQDEFYESPVTAAMRRHENEPRDRNLNDEELRALWNATGKLGTYGAMLRVLLLTGQRRSKVNFLKWDDIKQGVWHIDTEKREKPNCGKIHLPRVVLDIIEAQPKILNNPYVFAAERGRGAFNAFGQYADTLKKAMKETLPDMEPHTVHDLRRTMRTRLSALKIERSIAERCLGHVVGSKIERTYDTHDYTPEMTEAFEKSPSNDQDIEGT